MVSIPIGGGFENVGVRAVVEGSGQYLSDAQAVNAATRGMANEAERAAGRTVASSQSLSQLGGRMQEVGRSAVVLGGALAIPGIAAVKLAVDFETAFAGVRKTVDATEPEFARLRDGILDLSERLPASAAAIAQVAEAAGQLGVQAQDILQFTEVMIQLGEASDLTAETAAVSFARFAKVLDLPIGAVDGLSSVLVDLGNNSAATESEILDLATRMASTGAQINLSGDQVLAFAAALRELGVPSELAGTAISRTFAEIATAVADGGDELKQFARIAGVSADDFKQSFEQDAAAATATFTEGLGRIGDEGENLFAVLDDLGLGEVRVRNTLLAAANGGEVLREKLALAAAEVENNTARQEEFSRRLETTAAQLAIVRNQLTRALIDAGSDALPVIKGLVDVVSALLSAFRALPAPVRTSIIAATALTGILVAMGGAAAIAAGSILRLAPAASAASAGMTALGISATAAQVAIGVGLIGALIAGATLLGVFAANANDAAQASAEVAAQAAELSAVNTEEELRAAIAAQELQNERTREFIAITAERIESETLSNEELQRQIDLLQQSRQQLRDGEQDVDAFNEALDQQATQSRIVEKAQQDAADAMAEFTAETDDQAAALQNLTSSALASVLAANLLAQAASGVPIEEFGAGFEEAVNRLRRIISEEQTIAGLADELIAAAGGAPTARQQAAATGGGRAGGAGAAGGGLTPQDAVSRTQEEILQAYIEGGIRQAEATRLGQSIIANNFRDFQSEAARILGIEVPDSYRETWERLLAIQREAGEKLIEEERRIAEERLKALQEARRQTIGVLQFAAGGFAGAAARGGLVTTATLGGQVFRVTNAPTAEEGAAQLAAAGHLRPGERVITLSEFAKLQTQFFAEPTSFDPSNAGVGGSSTTNTRGDTNITVVTEDRSPSAIANAVTNASEEMAGAAARDGAA